MQYNISCRISDIHVHSKTTKNIRANKSDDNLKPPPAAICSTIPCSGQGKNLPSFRKVTSQHSQQLLSQEDPKAIVVFLFNFLLNNQVGRLFTKRTSIQLENQKSLRHYLTREALPREDHYRWLHISNPMALLIRTRGQRAEKYDLLCSPSWLEYIGEQ